MHEIEWRCEMYRQSDPKHKYSSHFGRMALGFLWQAMKVRNFRKFPNVAPSSLPSLKNQSVEAVAGQSDGRWAT